MSTQENDSKQDVGALGRAGQERLVGTIAPPEVGSDFEVDPTVLSCKYTAKHSKEMTEFLSALPIPGTKILAAFNYGMSLWGRTAKLICRLPTGDRIDYFLKVSDSKLLCPLRSIRSDQSIMPLLSFGQPLFAPFPTIVQPLSALISSSCQPLAASSALLAGLIFYSPFSPTKRYPR